MCRIPCASPVVNGESGPAIQNAKRMKVIHKYTSNSCDEFSFEVGKEVLLIHEYDDGWAVVHSPITGEQGVFPMVSLGEVDAPVPCEVMDGDLPGWTTSPILTEKKLLSHRNICTTKNLVSILQKLTKSKPNRLLALVQWKAQAGMV